MPAPPLPRRIVWLMALVSLVGYALRTNITIAQEYMAPALGLSMAQMGFISAWGFQLSYALFQLPGGFLGDRYGARLVLGLAIAGWAVASLAAGALGMALAPLTLAPLMVAAGWRAVFVASAAIAAATAALWFTLAPRRAEPSGTQAYVPIGVQLRRSLALLRQPPLLVLSVSYVLHSAVFFVFVFWFFRYLTEARGFSVLASGAWGSVPFFMAFASAPVMGRAADGWARRAPRAVVRRRVAMGCLLSAAAFVLAGAVLPTPTLAILALGVTVSALMSAEAPYWTTATALTPGPPGSAGGLLNLMGNLGGVLSIWLVPLMTEVWGWTVVLAVWGGVAAVAALLWLAVAPGD